MQGIKFAIGAALLAGVVVATSPASAALVVDVGSHQLLPNTPGQTVELFVSGGDLVDAAEVNVEIGDGTAGPLITDIDLKTNTIFAPASFTEADVINTGRQAQSNVEGPSDVAASGRFATVTLDTTGLQFGTFPLELTVNVGGTLFPTRFNNNGVAVPLTITDGSVSVPEPAALGLLGAAGLVLVGRRRRRV
jgi:hypothetical protein